MGAYGLTALTGSMGGHLTKGESFIDPVLNTIGLDYVKPIDFDPWLMAVVALLGIGALVMGLVQIRLNKLGPLRPGLDEGNLPTWPGPRMIEREDR